MSQQQKYRLTYYPMGGRAAVTRLLFVLGGVEFEDSRHGGEELEKMFEEQPERFPTKVVPVLELLDTDGKTKQVISQSNAIQYFAARVSGALPEDPAQAALVDEIVAQTTDMFDSGDGLTPTFALEGEAQLAARKKFVEGFMKTSLTRMNNLASKGAETGFALGGPKATLADALIYMVIHSFTSGWLDGIEASSVEPFPNLVAIHKKLGSLEPVAEFLKKFPQM